MRRETYADKCGRTIDRATALREAADTIIRQSDYHEIVREYVEFLTDDELMVWLVYPETGEFPDHLHASERGT